MQQIAGPPAPETLRADQLARRQRIVRAALKDQLARRQRIVRAALKKRLEREQPRGETEAERLRDVFHRTIRAFQLQPQFYRVVMVLTGTTDPYATELYQTLAAQSRDTVAMAFGGPFDADRAAILATLNAVLDESLRSWVMNRKAIADVYADVDNTIRLIYQYCPERG